jgi:hypothetical protein
MNPKDEAMGLAVKSLYFTSPAPLVQPTTPASMSDWGLLSSRQ